MDEFHTFTGFELSQGHVEDGILQYCNFSTLQEEIDNPFSDLSMGSISNRNSLGSSFVEELLGELREENDGTVTPTESEKLQFLQPQQSINSMCTSDDDSWSTTSSAPSSPTSSDGGYVSLDECPPSLTEILDPADFNALLDSLTATLPGELLFSTELLDDACFNLSKCTKDVIYHDKHSIDSLRTISNSKNEEGKIEKPEISYIELVAKAIMASSENSVLLADIYRWIEDNFPYYKYTKNSWRNSIRHNLSVNECFVKSKRVKNGRGFYWSIHSSCINAFKEGDFDRRKARRQVQQCNREFSSTLAQLHHMQSRCSSNTSTNTTNPGTYQSICTDSSGGTGLFIPASTSIRVTSHHSLDSYPKQHNNFY